MHLEMTAERLVTILQRLHGRVRLLVRPHTRKARSSQGPTTGICIVIYIARVLINQWLQSIYIEIDTCSLDKV